jgi:FkbM family methyltransferase
MSNILIKSLIKQIIGYGYVRHEWLFQKLYNYAIRGMNYSNPHYFENGEVEAMKYVFKKINQQEILRPILFDVGSNVGNYANELRRIFESKAQIFCFEPSVASFKKLQENLKKDQQICAYNFGFGNSEEILTIYYNELESTIASLYEFPLDHPWKGNSTEEVEIKKIDSFCASENIDEIHFLKVDVEGHELQALIGASEMIHAQKIHFIQFEFGFRQLDSRGYFRDFFNLLNERYYLYRIMRDGLYLIKEYHEGLEIFVGVGNFLAESRRLTKN